MRIGTRASALALVQARWVAEHLPGAELVEITTAGDRGERIGDKARWTSELELALLEERIDVAVHSAKDVPANLADGTELAAIPVREDPRDAICGCASLAELPVAARVGTGSLRRAAQLRALRPDLDVVEIRGNVDTRLRKLAAGEVDALVLALAGLLRLGRESEAGGVLDDLLPAAGQGALALQVRGDDREARAALQPLNHVPAQFELTAERGLTRALGASCNTAVGACAARPHVEAPMRLGDVELRGWVGLPDGSEWISDRAVGPAHEVGEIVAGRMIAVGARELLDRVEAAVG